MGHSVLCTLWSWGQQSVTIFSILLKMALNGVNEAMEKTFSNGLQKWLYYTMQSAEVTGFYLRQ